MPPVSSDDQVPYALANLYFDLTSEKARILLPRAVNERD